MGERWKRAFCRFLLFQSTYPYYSLLFFTILSWLSPIRTIFYYALFIHIHFHLLVLKFKLLFIYIYFIYKQYFIEYFFLIQYKTQNLQHCRKFCIWSHIYKAGTKILIANCSAPATTEIDFGAFLLMKYSMQQNNGQMGFTKQLILWYNIMIFLYKHDIILCTYTEYAIIYHANMHN